MKIVLVALLFAASAWAQNPIAGPTAACGPENVGFKVKLSDAPHTPVQPEPGKAVAYLFHDAGTDYTFAYPTVKLGIDGEWVGANHGNSYFAVSMNPGEHHLCATLQSSIVDDRVELAHFTAEAGKVYYYRTRLVLSGSVELLELGPIDNDQGAYLIATFSLSVSRAKKEDLPLRRFSDHKDTR
jgi:hypothetical protein